MLALALKWVQPMKLVHVVGNVRWRLQLLMRSPQIAVPFSGAGAPSRASESRDADDRYRLTRFRTLTHRAVRVLPPLLREWAAECFLRRANAPGPAAEHVVQYLLSAAKSQRKACIHEVASVAMGADNFYERQYRQYFNPAMGAFAMTATQALLASGAPARGHLWWHRRKTYAAMLDENAGAPPILVVDRETVAPLPLRHQPTGKNAPPLVAGLVVVVACLCATARSSRAKKFIARIRCARARARRRRRSARSGGLRDPQQKARIAGAAPA